MADQHQHVGMLPALERPEYFPDLHASLNVYIRDWLSPRLPDHYSISVERGLSMTDELGETRQFRPDVRIDEREAPGFSAVATAVYEEPTYVLELPEKDQRFLALRDEENKLVTTIEILSPANKVGSGALAFQRKQEALATRGVHLVEIDLLRTGSRRFKDEGVAGADYTVSVIRGGANLAEIWATSVGRPLPTVPVPLRSPDPALALPLEQIMREFLTKSGLGRRLAGKGRQ